MKIRNLVDLFAILPEDEKIIVDVLRQIIIETLNLAVPRLQVRRKFSKSSNLLRGDDGAMKCKPGALRHGEILPNIGKHQYVIIVNILIFKLSKLLVTLPPISLLPDHLYT